MTVADVQAAEGCLDWGWLLPEGGEAFRLSPEGLEALGGCARPSGPPPKGAEKRAHPRVEVMRPGTVLHEPSGRAHKCTILDFSLGGARLQLYAPDLPRDGLVLLDAKMGAIHRLRLAWRVGPLIGVSFTTTTMLPDSPPPLR